VRSLRLLAPGSEGKRLWVRLYVQLFGTRRAAMIVANAANPLEPGNLKRITFFADTAEEAERLALAYLGEGVAQNQRENQRHFPS
jgi:hypothetical protein